MESYNRHLYENEYGFITWQILGNACVINTLYVKPEHRQEGRASELADYVVELIRGKVENLVCEIDIRSNTAIEAYNSITKYGFEKTGQIGNYIILQKDL